MTDRDIVNKEQAEAWDGPEGEIWTAHADRYDRAMARISRHLFGADAGVIESTDDVLDIGCGTGAPTRAAARLARQGMVVGIDLSARMLELARRRSADDSIDNVSFVQGDAQVFAFEPASFDLAVSNFGAMFFNDPVAAFANVGTGLRSGGRLALLAWRAMAENVWMSSIVAACAAGRELPSPPPDAPSPFAFADPARVERTFGEAGYQEIDLRPIDEPVDLGADRADTVEFFAQMGVVQSLMADLDDDARASVRNALSDLAQRYETADGVLLPAAAWLITARRS